MNLFLHSTNKEGAGVVQECVCVAELCSALPEDVLQLTATKPIYLCGITLCNAGKLRCGKQYSCKHCSVPGIVPSEI